MKKHWKYWNFVKITDEKQAIDIKKIYDHYLDKRNDILKNTHFKVEDVFGDIQGEEGNSPKK